MIEVLGECEANNFLRFSRLLSLVCLAFRGVSLSSAIKLLVDFSLTFLLRLFLRCVRTRFPRRMNDCITDHWVEIHFGCGFLNLQFWLCNTPRVHSIAVETIEASHELQLCCHFHSSASTLRNLDFRPVPMANRISIFLLSYFATLQMVSRRRNKENDDELVTVQWLLRLLKLKSVGLIVCIVIFN